MYITVNLYFMEYLTQNNILLEKLMEFYKRDNNLLTMLNIINGNSSISLRIVDWFSTNYSKNYYIVYLLDNGIRFKVYNDYKLKLKAYSKKRFDPFCRWQRIIVPLDDINSFETTVGQLNFFKWALENKVIDYIEKNYKQIDSDMNIRNSHAKKKINSSISSNSSSSSTLSYQDETEININNKTRKKREELSLNASRGVKKEAINIVLEFN